MPSKKLTPNNVAKHKTRATIKGLLLRGIYSLTKKSTSPELDTEVLLAHAINKDRTFVYSHENVELTPAQLKKFDTFLSQRAQGVPVAYTTGVKEFYSLNFAVNKNVLVPRPETELLVERALTIMDTINTPTVVDTGTGSGAIIIALSKTFTKKAHFIATDISRAALIVAKKNAQVLGVSKKIVFKHGNLLKPLGKNKADVLVANLPYVTAGEYRANKHLKHEPKSAIVATQKGLSVITEYLTQSRQYMKPHAYIVLEIGYGQSAPIQKIATNIFGDSLVNFSVTKDYAGIERIITLEYKQ